MEGIVAANLLNKQQTTTKMMSLFSKSKHRHNEIQRQEVPPRSDEYESVEAPVSRYPKSKRNKRSDISDSEGSDKDKDSDISDEEDDDDKEVKKQLAELPPVKLLRDIFEKLIDFSLKKMMAKDMQDKLTALSLTTLIASGERKRYEELINPNDVSLEKNINILFNKTSFDIELLKSTLCEYVTLSDPRTLTPEQRIVIEKKKVSFEKNKKLILQFYPHLLNTMAALTVYITNEEKKKSELPENDYDKHSFKAWVEVSGYLKSIQTVISHGIAKYEWDDIKHPKDFMSVINRRNEHMKILEDALLKNREKIQEIDSNIIKRDNELRQAAEPYTGIENRRNDIEAAQKSLRGQISQLDDPVQMATENIAQIQSIASSRQ